MDPGSGINLSYLCNTSLNFAEFGAPDPKHQQCRVSLKSLLTKDRCSKNKIRVCLQSICVSERRPMSKEEDRCTRKKERCSVEWVAVHG